MTSISGFGSPSPNSVLTISGLGTGIDTQGIINSLVAVEQQKVTAIQAQGVGEQNALSTWATIRSALSDLTTAEQSLVHATDWQLLTASSSDSTIATASAGSGTMSGALTFTVNSLAQSGVVRSNNTISSLSAHVTNSSSFLVGAGGAKLGLASVASNSGVSLGSHTIQVTQSSAAAVKNGTTALGASTVIDGSDNTLQVVVNGTTYNLVLAAGTYSSSALATAVQQALTAAGAGGQLSATLGGSGALMLATTGEGSAANVRVTGGTALAALGLSVDAQALQGTDGIVTVDNGAAQTFGNISPLVSGGSIALTAGAGTITATLAGGLRAGTMTAANVSAGDGSLQSVVSAINGANTGVTAAAIQVGTNAYRLQIGAATSGAGNDPNIAASVFDPTIVGGLTTLSQGVDASITVGSGAGAYQITSSTNSMANVLPGVTVNLVQQSTSPVTITVGHDASTLADSVQKIVDAANSVKTALANATAFDPSSQQASPLTGDLTVERLSNAVYHALSDIVPGANPTSPGIAGISVDKDGNYTFDKTAFTTAYNANPSGVTSLFSQGGSSTSPALSFVAATSATRAGSYAVNITNAATQAMSTSTGLPSVGTTIRARVGSTVAAYTVQSGDTLASVSAGLNSAFAAQNIGLVASVNGSNLQINTARYGSQASTDVAWNGSTYVTSTGTDVAGTINGVAATGIGQTLAAPQTDPTLAGLAIQVSGTQTGALGTFTYTPGIAARLDQVINDATDPVVGYITSAEQAHKDNEQLINHRVSEMSDQVNQYQNRLRAQFAQLESVLAQLKNTGSFLSGQISTLG